MNMGFLERQHALTLTMTVFSLSTLIMMVFSRSILTMVVVSLSTLIIMMFSLSTLTMVVFSLSTLTITVFYLSIEFAGFFFFFTPVLRHYRVLHATKDVFKTKGNKDKIQKDASRN